MHSGPLRGVKVIDFSIIYCGPFAGIQLADLGADVLKVEPLEGDQLRLSRAAVPGHSKSFQWMNRGKKSIALNLQDPRGREIAHKLAADADVVVINYRPGVPKRLGVDYKTLSKLNPRLIYGDSIGFGREGELLRAEGAPAGRVSIPEELSDDPQGTLHMQELVHEATGPQRPVRPMVDMARSETGIGGPASALGGETDATLGRLGHAEAEIARLRAEGVVA